eukprot:4572712-Pyramimonas_sp.AAC.1
MAYGQKRLLGLYGDSHSRTGTRPYWACEGQVPVNLVGAPFWGTLRMHRILSWAGRPTCRLC